MSNKEKLSLLLLFINNFGPDMTQQEIKKNFKRLKSLGVAEINGIDIDTAINTKQKIVIGY